MRILVCGDREWDNQKLMRNILENHIDNELTLIHGNARGADKMSEYIIRDIESELYENNFHTRVFKTII